MMKRETRINVTINANTNNTEKEINTMKKMSKNTRMEVLRAAGINTEDMLQFILENGNKADIEKILDEFQEDPVVKKLKAEGYVKNPKEFRRWIMAQMFRNLNYNCTYTGLEGYNDYIDNCLDFNYQVEFMIDEVNRIIHIQRDGDTEKLAEYTRICTLPAIKESCEEITKKVFRKYRHINKYITEKLTELECVNALVMTALTYKEIHKNLKRFLKYLRWFNMSGEKKSATWKDMYKGIGAYWTCKNMIMFHDCVVGEFFKLNQYESMIELESKARTYFAHPDYFNRESEGGFRMFAFMKKLINDNHFDFVKRMKELGVPGYRYF